MNYFYIIAFATLGGTVGLAAFVLGFQGAYLAPLAEEERESYLAMDCTELKEYTGKGLYWSPQNSLEARTLVAGCK